MKVTNAVGTIKNITTKGTGETIITASFSERDENNKCIVTMPLVFKGQAKLLFEQDQVQDGDKISITGRIETRFDRRPGIDNDKRFKPFTQLHVETLMVL